MKKRYILTTMSGKKIEVIANSVNEAKDKAARIEIRSENTYNRRYGLAPRRKRRVVKRTKLRRSLFNRL